MDQSSVLLLFSGGQDSATLLAWALDSFERVETIGFDYGQRHHVEMQARQSVLKAVPDLKPEWKDRLGPDQVVDLTGYGAISDSALTRDRAIEMAETGLPNTFVPARNLVFLTVAGGYAYRRGIDTLAAGMCQTDFSGYPDCREETLKAQEQALALGLDRPICLITPLMEMTKADTWSFALSIGGNDLVDAIVEHSHTCYLGEHGERHDWGYGCGTCPACELREKGWTEFRARGA